MGRGFFKKLFPRGSRREAPEAPRRRLSWKARAYLAMVVFMVSGGVAVYVSWFRHYQESHPRVTWGRPERYAEEHLAELALVWREEVIPSPATGTLSLAGKGRICRVARGETLATVKGGGGAVVVRSPAPGYFVPYLDGQEGKWGFSSLWRGDGVLPDPPSPKAIAEGSPVTRGQGVGKLVYQPQELRCIAYLPLTPAVAEEIRRGRVKVRLASGDRPVMMELRAHQTYGVREKIYGTLPVFPPGMLPGRRLAVILLGREQEGTAVPEEAVTFTGGRQVVFVVTGSELRLRDVQGIPLPGGRFLVTEGLAAGELVLEKAEGAREGRVKLW